MFKSRIAVSSVVQRLLFSCLLVTIHGKITLAASSDGISGVSSPPDTPILPRAYPLAERHISDKVHGILMGMTVALIMPLGALSWYVFDGILAPRTVLRIHVLCQLLGLAMLISGFGVGIWVAITHAEVFNDPHGHAVLGVILVILFIIQTLLGTYHHLFIFRSRNQNSSSSSNHEAAATSAVPSSPSNPNPYFRLAHVWLGRALWIIAACEGGTGLLLAANSPGGEKAYGSVVGVVGVLYIALIIMRLTKNRREGNGGDQTEKEAGGQTNQPGIGAEIENSAVEHITLRQGAEWK